jgi:ABC-2 type transport system permease protein
MKSCRISALVKRHIYLFPRSPDRLVDAFFWPSFDIAMYGLMATWLTSMSPDNRATLLAVVFAMVFWRIILQAKCDFGLNMLEECFNRNMTNLISSPATKAEWLVANLIVGIIKHVFVIAVCSATAYFLLSVNVFSVGWLLMPYIVSLTFSGWAMGFVASALVLEWGARAQSLTWVLGFVFAPFLAIYYPVRFLPEIAQKLSWALPPTYLFEGIRSIVLDGVPLSGYLLTSFVLNCFYIVLAILVLNASFERCRDRGFDHLE